MAGPWAWNSRPIALRQIDGHWVRTYTLALRHSCLSETVVHKWLFAFSAPCIPKSISVSLSVCLSTHVQCEAKMYSFIFAIILSDCVLFYWSLVRRYQSEVATKWRQNCPLLLMGAFTLPRETHRMSICPNPSDACKSWRVQFMEQYIKCLKRLWHTALRRSRRWSLSWFVTLCCTPDRVSITCCFSSQFHTHQPDWLYGFFGCFWSSHA